MDCYRLIAWYPGSIEQHQITGVMRSSSERDYLPRQCHCIRLHLRFIRTGIQLFRRNSFQRLQRGHLLLFFIEISRGPTRYERAFRLKCDDSKNLRVTVENFFEHTCAALASLPISDVSILFTLRQGNFVVSRGIHGNLE